ncbi:TetR/AcrR family transcriptional regulator [Streptomyces longisporoflavus]|uniref:TetR/AcrR family transcriptional regulator n=1 Tax=Streptomyces longisporoflavus TaxID=28044 RepID=A0ABW7R3G4_9ACTN
MPDSEDGLSPSGADDEPSLLQRVAQALQELHPQATMSQIAREAGVSPMVLYRRYPTKDALLLALAASFFDGLLHCAQEARALPAGQQLEYFLRTAGLHLATSRSVLPYAFGEMSLPEQRHQIYAAIADLLATAKKGSHVHPDIALADIGAIVWGMRGVIESAGALVPDAWERHLDIALAGLASRSLSFSRPPMDVEQLDAVISGRHAED